MSWGEAKYIIDNVHAGIAPDNMQMFTAQVGDGKAIIRFKEPKDTKIQNPETGENQTIVSVKGVKIVMKQGSEPIANENDGKVVLDCTTPGKYANDGFVVEGLTNDIPYTFAAFPYSDQMVHNRNVVNQRTITPKAYILLGFRINKNDSNPKTRVEYTEMAAGLTPAAVNLSTGAFDYGSFGDYWFVTENKPYMVYSNGQPAYELDPNDYTKKLDGNPSDVSNVGFDGNAMAKIPLVWMKQWEDGGYEYCNICNIQLDDSYKADAHTRADGSVMDHIWLSCFEGALNSSKVRSIKGLTPMNNQTGTNEITYAKNNGSLWYTRSWSQRNLINMLLILMSKSDNSQEAFGYGYYTGGSSSSPNYLPTGYRSNKGQFYGTNATRDTVKVFHIENWWGDVWERIAGLMYVGGKIKTKMVAPYNTTGDGYTDTGVAMGGTSGGFISATKMTNQGRLPVTMSGSETTYTCDGGWYNASQVDYALVGGASADGLLVGASAVHLYDLVSYAAWYIGAALSCEQPAA